jgi:CBS domain-containing protein
MKIRDIMTQPPHTCRFDTDLATASRRMKEFDCGFLPVLDQHGRVKGVLTDRDIAIAVGDRRRSASNVTAREAMSEKVHTCLPDEEIHRVLNRMATWHLRRLPVVTADDDLMGVVSIDDIILWGVEQGGVSAKELAGALRSICRPKDAAAEDVLSGLLDG